MVLFEFFWVSVSFVGSEEIIGLYCLKINYCGCRVYFYLE